MWDVLVSLSNYHPVNTGGVFVVTHLYYCDLIFAFTLEFKQIVLVIQIVSCVLCIQPTLS